MKQLIITSFLLLASLNSNAQNTVCFDIVANPHASISGLNVFTKYIDVFGVKIFATQSVLDEDIKHCAAVMAEYLDNNEDGIIDNTLVVGEMVANNASMVMFNVDGSADQTTFFNTYNGNWQLQDLYGSETHPTGSSQANGFDATLEEVLHLITHVGYAGAYPSVWGESIGTSLGNAMDIARGGQFITIPTSYPAAAWYHYDDNTCDYSCMATEYVYWSLTTLLGAQDYTGRCAQISNEWEMCTTSTFQATDLAMNALLIDPSYKFATSIPDGNYCPAQLNLSDLELYNQGVVLSPNPSNGIFNVLFNSAPEHLKIVVFNVQGRSVFRMEDQNINNAVVTISDAPSGTYFVEITTELGRDTLKYIKH